MLRTTTAPAQLISMPEIAELAGVHRPVVTTWRRRHADFPSPVDGSRGRPLFDARSVMDWLVDTGRAERDQIEPDLRLHLLTSLAGGMPNQPGAPAGRRRSAALAPEDLVAAITALICLRHLDDELLRPEGRADRHVIAELRDRAADADPDDELLRAEIDALPADAGWLATAVDELIEAAWGCRQAYERVLAARQRLGVPDLYADAVTPALAKLMAGLSGAREHADTYGEVRVADPAARAGDLLMAVREQLGESSEATFVAAEADPFLARILRRRLAVHEVAEPDRRVHLADGLPVTGPTPDALVTRLPYRPKEERDVGDRLAAVRRIGDALAPDQTAVVLGPADLLVGGLSAYHPSAGTRRALLTSGRVEAVIQLPGGVVPFRPGYQTALWVLRHEDRSPWQGRVLLADVSDRPLTAEVAETLVWDITTWRRHGHQPDEHLRGYARQVAVTELTAHRRPLTTRRPARLRETIRDPRDTIARVAEAEIELGQLAQPATAPRPDVRAGLAVRDVTTRPPTQPIAALVRSGHLIVVKGHRIAAVDIIPDGHHTVLGVTELTRTAPVGGRSIDRGVSATTYPHAKLTQPGDLVVTLVPHLAVHLDEDGYSMVEFPARVLRITPAGRERFAPRVLAALLAGATVGARAPGAIRAAVRLVDLQLPMLPPAEVARLDALLATAEARRELARREIDLLDELCRVATTGVTDGTLTITDPLRGR